MTTIAVGLTNRFPRLKAARRARLRAARRDELELLLRGIENRAERARRGGAAWPDLSWLREELRLNAGQLAA